MGAAYFLAVAVGSALGSSVGFLVLLLLLVACGVVTTAIGRLPLRWAYALALLLWTAWWVRTWHVSGRVGFAVEAVLVYYVSFAVGATVGRAARRRLIGRDS
jgi:hypothetical protein